MGSKERQARIVSYSGQGSLSAWLKVVGVRLAMDWVRNERKVEGRPLHQELVRAEALDPELQYIKERYRIEFKWTLQESLSVLSDRQGTIIRLYFLDGMSAAALGPIYRVSARTIQRWISSAQKLMLTKTRCLLGDKLDLGASQLDSLLGMLLSDLDISFHRLLPGDELGVGKGPSSISSLGGGVGHERKDDGSEKVASSGESSIDMS